MEGIKKGPSSQRAFQISPNLNQHHNSFRIPKDTNPFSEIQLVINLLTVSSLPLSMFEIGILTGLTRQQVYYELTYLIERNIIEVCPHSICSITRKNLKSYQLKKGGRCVK